MGEDFTGVGITISPVQVRIALVEQRTKDQKQRCIFLLGDFLAPPLDKQFDLIYSIEAFAHTTYPNGFLQAAAKFLKPKGRLVLCDDFLSERADGSEVSAREVQWLEIFHQGWRVKGLWTPECAVSGSFREFNLH